ncbi:proline iminopeptidase [Salirhabdus euzebyi]|uniref:Proline iminopeptidase n=1 Tax=Salirhabdus euzebyi TaxID=394506 RepID=A0A841Q591_9BACI|nr:alpha/beta hydrolase [Salirhabdus euzebyi]MBB6453554.1 proline iminopeptidase [Salirhabdus euzebyi]
MAKWKRKMVTTSRGTFEVFIKGEGLPICVTHLYSEFNETGDYFADIFTDHYQVYLVNLKNAGNTDKANEAHELSMIDTALDLEEIRKSFGHDSWTFAGHSTGGMLGLVYGIHFSKFLHSLIIVGSAGREYGSSSSECIYNPGHSQYQRMQQLIEQLKSSSLTEQEKKELSIERTKLSLYEPINYNNLFSKNISKKMSASRMNFFAREVLIYDVTRRLEAITTKTVIMCGRHDVQCPVSFSIEINEKIPNSSLHIFERSNHYPFLEEEAAFREIIDSFLTQS